MGYTPGQLDAVSRYLGLPGGYSAAGIPPAAVQPAAVTMPTVEMGPAAPAPMPIPGLGGVACATWTVAVCAGWWLSC